MEGLALNPFPVWLVGKADVRMTGPSGCAADEGGDYDGESVGSEAARELFVGRDTRGESCNLFRSLIGIGESDNVAGGRKLGFEPESFAADVLDHGQRT